MTNTVLDCFSVLLIELEQEIGVYVDRAPFAVCSARVSDLLVSVSTRVHPLITSLCDNKMRL